MLTLKTLILVGMVAEFCYNNKLPFTITSLAEHVDGRISRSHAEHRAFDFSVKGWSKVDIRNIKADINQRAFDIAAISKRDNIARALVDHGEGASYHIHAQTRP